MMLTFKQEVLERTKREIPVILLLVYNETFPWSVSVI